MSSWLRWAFYANPYTYALHLMGHVVFDFGPDEYECTGECQVSWTIPLHVLHLILGTAPFLGDVLVFEDICADSTGGGVVTRAEGKGAYGIVVPARTCVVVLAGGCVCLHLLSFAALRRKCSIWLA